jgi:carbamoyltransferase
MGLASYGEPTMADAVRKLVPRTPDGAFRLDLDYFEFHSSARRSHSDKFVALFGPPRSRYEPIDFASRRGRRFAAIAASVQRVLEDILVDLAAICTNGPDLATCASAAA